jgi:hypothetical protein
MSMPDEHIFLQRNKEIAMREVTTAKPTDASGTGMPPAPLFGLGRGQSDARIAMQKERLKPCRIADA